MEIRKTDVFAKWLDKLKDPKAKAKAKVLVRIARLADGNLGDVKPASHLRKTWSCNHA